MLLALVLVVTTITVCFSLLCCLTDPCYSAATVICLQRTCRFFITVSAVINTIIAHANARYHDVACCVTQSRWVICVHSEGTSRNCSVVHRSTSAAVCWFSVVSSCVGQCFTTVKFFLHYSNQNAPSY